MIKSSIFTEKELKVIDKKLKNKRLTQVDSNYLTKFIRPKLNEIKSIDTAFLLNKMKYNQKIKSIENRIKKIISENIKSPEAIVIYGSAVQTNYEDYNDIDILVVTKNKIPQNEKYKKIRELKNLLDSELINSDIEIYDKKTIKTSYSHSPSLIYQLKDKKVIYGKLEINKKINLHNIDLKMKLDWSYLEDHPKGIEIYKALRNVILIKLLLNKIINNQQLKQSLYDEIGKETAEKLKNNLETKTERKIALLFLKKLLEETENKLKGDLWEKIEL